MHCSLKKVAVALLLFMSSCAAIAGFGDRPAGEGTSSTLDGGGDSAPSSPLLDPTFGDGGVVVLRGHANALARFDMGGDLLWVGSQSDQDGNLVAVAQRLTRQGGALAGASTPVLLPFAGEINERATAVAANDDGTYHVGGVGTQASDASLAHWLRTFARSGARAGVQAPQSFPTSSGGPAITVAVRPFDGNAVSLISCAAPFVAAYKIRTYLDADAGAPTAMAMAMAVANPSFVVTQVDPVAGSLMISRFVAPLTRDMTWGNDGGASVAFAHGVSNAAMVFRGKELLVGGTTQDRSRAFVQSVVGAGTLDGSASEVSLGEAVSFASMAIQGDKLVMVGCREGSPKQGWVGRFDISTGLSFDASFRAGGHVIIPADHDECPRGLVIDDEGGIVVLLGSGVDAAPDRLVRLTP